MAASSQLPSVPDLSNQNWDKIKAAFGASGAALIYLQLGQFLCESEVFVRMTNNELRDLRLRIKFDMRSMALCCGIALSTYSRYEDGTAAVPARIERAALELEQIDKRFNVESAIRLRNVKYFMGAGNDFD